MDSNLTVNACIGVRDGCGMRYLVDQDGHIEFSLGATRYPFELVFDVPALRHFMELAGNALEQVAASVIRCEADAGGAREETEQ